MDIVSGWAFGIKLDSLKNVDDGQCHPAVTKIKKLFSVDATLEGFIAWLFPRLAKLLGYAYFSAEAQRFFQQLVIKIIDQRSKQQKNDGDNNDFSNDFVGIIMKSWESDSIASNKSKYS